MWQFVIEAGIGKDRDQKKKSSASWAMQSRVRKRSVRHEYLPPFQSAKLANCGTVSTRARHRPSFFNPVKSNETGGSGSLQNKTSGPIPESGQSLLHGKLETACNCSLTTGFSGQPRCCFRICSMAAELFEAGLNAGQDR